MSILERLEKDRKNIEGNKLLLEFVELTQKLSEKLKAMSPAERTACLERNKISVDQIRKRENQVIAAMDANMKKQKKQKKRRKPFVVQAAKIQ